MEKIENEVGGAALAVLEALTSALEDPSQWRNFLISAMRATGASRAVLSALAPQARGSLWIAEGFDDQVKEQWHSYFRHIDPKFAATKIPEPGQYKVDRGEDLVPDEAFLASEFYKDFAGPNNMRWSRSAWIRPTAPNSVAYGVLLYRGNNETNFDEDAVLLLERFARQLSCQEQLGVANALGRATGLDDEGSAVFLLNEAGGVVMSNQIGVDMVASGAVRDNGKLISFMNHNASAWLGALINDGGLNSKVFGSVARQRETLEGIGSVQFSLYPFKPIGATLSLMPARYALTLKPLDARDVPDLARAAHQMYRWTGSELDTVRRLTAGDELPDIAVARSCSVETVRSHLKNAKRKAGVKRQVDLVRLMMALES